MKFSDAGKWLNSSTYTYTSHLNDIRLFLRLEKMLFVVNMFSTCLHSDLWNLIKKDRCKGTGKMWNLIKFFTAISVHVDFISELKLCQTLTDWLVQFHVRSKDEAKSEYWTEDDGIRTDIRIGNWFHCEPNDTIKIYEAKKTRSDAISHHHHNHQMTHDIYMSHGMWSHSYAIHFVHFLANKFSNQINLLLSYSNRCCGICDISKKNEAWKKRITGADAWFQNASE